MIWRFLRSVPKFVFALAVVVASLALLFFWNVRRSVRQTAARIQPAQVEDNTARQALVASKPLRLLLVDNDLYDLDTGAIIFKNWLQDGMPGKLFWEAGSKTMLAEYERGFVRYRLDGTEEKALPQKYPYGIADDYKWIVYARDKDIWRADVDWRALELVNERKVTSIGQFNHQNFAMNIVLGTDKTLLIRSMNKVLHVDFVTGAVKPMDLFLEQIGKRRSPDSKGIVGLENGKFYYYEVDTDDAKYFPVGRVAINDYQWLGDAQCVALVEAKNMVLYDRAKRTLTELLTLPFQCNRIGEPSPDGRFVFCASGVTHKGVLVDTAKKGAVPVIGGEGVTWISNDTFAFSREVPDSDLRGTWLQKPGEGERRISPEPYLVGKNGGFIRALPSSSLVVFATKHGVATMKPDGSELVEVAKLAHPPERVLGIQDRKY